MLKRGAVNVRTGMETRMRPLTAHLSSLVVGAPLVVAALLFVLGALLLGGCGGPQLRPDQIAVTVVSLQDINCSNCLGNAAKSVGEMPGVLSADMDRRKAEVSVRYDKARVSPQAVTARISALGYGVVLGAGKGRYDAHAKFGAGLDVEDIKEPPASLELASLAVAGKVTVVDFRADWCGPCRQVDKEMLAQLRKHDDIALRRIDIGDWDTEFAAKHLRGVANLPYVIVFGPDGKESARIVGLKLDQLRSAIETARGQR